MSRSRIQSLIPNIDHMTCSLSSKNLPRNTVDFEAACSVYIRFRGVNGYKLGAGDVGLGAFLHAHRHDTEGLDRRRNARDGRRRGFQTHVIRPGHAAANPHAPTTADLAIIQRSRTSIPASVAAQSA